MLFHWGSNVHLNKISNPDWNIYRTLGLLYVFFLIPLIFQLMPGRYICPKPGPDLNCMVTSPRSISHLLYVPRFCAAKEYQSHLPKQAFSTYYQKWIIICVYLVIVKRAHATAKVARAVKTRYQVLSNFITVTLPHSICQKQVISFRILRRCIQVKTKKGERRSSSCVHVTQTDHLYQMMIQWEWDF